MLETRSCTSLFTGEKQAGGVGLLLAEPFASIQTLNAITLSDQKNVGIHTEQLEGASPLLSLVPFSTDLCICDEPLG